VFRANYTGNDFDNIVSFESLVVPDRGTNSILYYKHILSICNQLAKHHYQD
jgi:hypothetical protein